MSQNIFNFSAGPAALPQSIIEQLPSKIIDFDRGMSILEISHRSKKFKAYAEKSESSLRRILDIDDNYEVLFLQGGATHQFTMIPQNLSNNGEADYLITGGWSKKAAAYAEHHTNVNIVSDSSENNFTDVADKSSWKMRSSADYFFYCANETVHGVEIHESLDVNIPLICDMSSTLCTRPIDVNKFDLIFAGAQKNLGIAGLTIVLARKDFIENQTNHLTPIMRYDAHANDNSMLNTSPVFAWFVAGLVFEWIEEQGGLIKMADANKAKSQLLYDYIDQSSLYENPVNSKYRSWVNIPFTLSANNLDEEFLTKASKSGLYNLKGHRTVGGMRASVYNSMPIEGVERLISFMREFESRQ